MRHKSLIRMLTAAFMTVCLTIGSAGTLPVTVYGEGEGTDTTDIISTDSPDFDIDEKVADLLAQGDYEEGRAIVLYDTESPVSDEELVGADDLIAGAEQIAEVSAESYVNATGENLQIPDGELVGASSDSADDDRIAILVIEDQSRSTEELLRELLSDPRVLSAEPDYIFSVNSADSDDSSDELPGNDSVIPDTESSTGSEDELFVQNPSVSIPEDEYAGQDSDTDYDTADETVTSDIADLSVPDSDVANIDGPGSADQSTDALVSDDAEDEIIVGASGDLTPYQWGMSDGSNRYAGAMLENTEVYSVNSPDWNTVGAANAEGVIAVIDTGIDHTHPDLKDNMYVIPDSVQEKLGCGEYGISTQIGVRDKTDTMDVDGHGTHCAGIIAASWNNKGVSGVTSGAKLIAVRALDDKGFTTYSSILFAQAFVQNAKENGIDIRATSNSYSVDAPNYALRVLIEELGNLGIICVFASGNDSSYINLLEQSTNHLWDLPNVVIVNASAENGNKAPFSNFSQNETHIFAPGVNILSTVPTAGSDEAPIDYFAELDNAPLYTDPSWRNLSSDMIAGVSLDWLEYPYFDYFQVTQMIDISSCGQTPALRFKLLKDVPAGKEMTYCFLIPVGKNAPVGYVSADILTPDSDTTTTLRVRTRTDGDTISDVSSSIRDDHYDWVHRSVINLDKNDRTIDMVDEVFLPVYIDLSKNDGSSLKAGECIYIDNICVGSSSYRNGETAFGILSGTSMAAPFGAGMAMILYKGKEVNRQNAGLLAAALQGLVRTKDSLAGYCTSGGVLDYSVDSDAMLPVINSATLNSTDLTITLAGYFFGNRGTQSSVNLAGTDLEIVSWNNNEVVVKCPDRMASGLQKIVLTDAGGLTTRGAFSLTVPEDSEIEDTATGLYETTLPDIPTDVIDADESICTVCALNDRIYITAGKKYGQILYAEKLVSYSIKDKKWEVTATIPEEGLANCSMAAYQGTVFLNGTDVEGEAYLYYYSPSRKDWYILKGSGVNEATIVNYKNNLLSIGGNVLDHASEIRLIDVSTGKATVIADLGYKIAHAQTAVCGDTLCLYEGYVYNEETKKWKQDQYEMACYTISDKGISRDTKKEIEIEPLIMKGSKDLLSAICASDKNIYLVGLQLSQDASGSVIDPSGYQVADGDTWVYSNQMKNLGKRLSHTVVTHPKAVVYKGVLYGFGLNTQDGNPTTYVARATVVDETPDTPIQDTIKVKIPTAKKGLIYNGKAQTGVPASAEGYYNIKNNRKTAPGTYKARAELIDPDYLVWEDGTSAAKTITWSIAPISVTGVKLDKTNLTVYAGTTGQLKATVIPSGANNKAVTWKSADTKIAKVDQSGKVTGVKAGTVKVTVTTKDGSKKATCTVKVVIAGVPVYRLYDIKGTGDHLFTTSAYEKDTLTLRGWKYEGIAWYEPKTSSRAVYRSYNPNNGLHMYTYSDTERKALAGAGWKMEGIAFYSCTDSSKVPVYRLYNPNGGTHFFTKAVAEKNMLVKAGWKYEGIGFYALGI